MALDEATVVCFGPVDWSFNWQIAQEVAVGLSTRHRVLYVENTGARTPNVRDLPRVHRRFVNWRKSGGRVTTGSDGVSVFSPVVLPFPYLSWAVEINARILLRTVKDWIGERNGPLIVINYLPNPANSRVVRELQPDVVIYYRTDRVAASSPAAQRLHEVELEVIAEADLVLVTTPQLSEEIQHLAHRVEMLEAGVRSEQFAEARRSRHVPLDLLSGLRGPIVGFVGTLRHVTDLELVARAARLAPDLDFVLAGPIFVDVTMLEKIPNVRLLGTISHSDVSALMARFDVGLLPYVIDNFTAGIMPMKLKEYLAAGLPVVSTALPAVSSFAEEHPDLITIAEDAEGFVTSIREAMAGDSPAEVARRQTVSAQFDWEHQIARLNVAIDELLRSRSRVKA